MYYVIFVGSGNETKIEQIIRRVTADGLCRECFHPVRHLKKKIQGAWTNVYSKLIPGYVFVESGDIFALHQAIIRTPGYKKILRSVNEDGSFDFCALSPDEVHWLHAISGLPQEEAADTAPASHTSASGSAAVVDAASAVGQAAGAYADTAPDASHAHPAPTTPASTPVIIELSQVGFDENDKVVILSGPLKGREALVKKINLHRRTADIEVPFMDRRLTLSLGIEIIAKPEAQS